MNSSDPAHGKHPVTLLKYAPNLYPLAVTADLIECYRDVFSEEPWNEWLKCPKCDEYWGVKDRELLAAMRYMHCNVPLVDFWPRHQVIGDIEHEITEKTSCYLAFKDSRVVGFCWGYPIKRKDLETKLGISFESVLGVKPDELVAYQDDVGVIVPYRGQKIAKILIAKRHQDFIAQGLRVGIVRTRMKPKPSVTYLWYLEKLGYKVLAEYPVDDGRVILGRKLEGLSDLLPVPIEP